jgi:hypothetical protein
MRTIVWMSAWRGFMQASIYFSGNYIEDFSRVMQFKLIAK